MNHLGTALLYLGRLCRSFPTKMDRQKIDFDSFVVLHMYRTLCINYVDVLFNISALLIAYLVPVLTELTKA